ncbi:MAG: hypothetical protein QM770_11565 [Tepidisphaeraceae bacterium]
MFLAVDVLRDQLAREVQDVLRRAVILLKLDDVDLRIVALEVEDVPQVRAAPGVDALVGVADDANVAVLGRQRVREEVLGAIGVLVLVDEDVLKAVLELGQDVRVIAQCEDGADEQVVEVERGRLGEHLLVLRVDAGDGLVEEVAGVLSEVFGGDELVLGVADPAVNGRGAEIRAADLQRLERFLDDLVLVGRVVDEEVRREADALGVVLQNAKAERVERADHRRRLFQTAEIPHLPADDVRHAVLHFTGGFICESNREDGTGLYALADQVGDPTCQYPRLARTRAGNHQKRPVDVFDGGALLVRESLQQFVRRVISLWSALRVHSRHCNDNGVTT